MFVSRLVYYLRSIFVILAGFSNWPVIFGLALGSSKNSLKEVHLKKSGYRFRVRNLMDAWIIKETCLDRDYERVAVPVQDGWNIIDIGAGLGDYTVLAARENPHGRVYAYEPFQESLKLLEDNLKLNQIQNVQVFSEAVSDQAGKLRLGLIGEAVQHSTSLTEGGFTAHEVPAISLSQALDRLTGATCDLLKIDCEGAEYEILMKADPACWSRIRQIVLEYHDGVTRYNHQDLMRFFTEKGYRVREFSNPVHREIGFLYIILDSNIEKL
jgi:FkbM family methyltransferase